MNKPSRQIIVHPILFAMFPVLSFVSHNFWESMHGGILFEAFVLVGIVLGSVMALWLVSGWVMKNYEKAAIFSSAFVFLFFSYGHFLRIIRNVKINVFDLTVSAGHISSVLWVVCFAALMWFAFKRSQQRYSSLTSVLNIISIILVVLPLMTIGTQVIKRKTVAIPGGEKINTIKEMEGFAGQEEYRDIYYLIFDRYANKQVLKELYGFDNSSFLDLLTDRGFYVANESTANYLKTAHSLVSSLNMEYINWLEDVMGKESKDWTPLYGEMLLNSRVLRFLKSKGYKTIHLGSWWEPTSKNKYADYNFTFEGSSRFLKLFIANTAISPILEMIKPESNQFYHHWRRVKWKFDKLEEVPAWEGPTFTFMHMCVPHYPHVFNEEGSFIDKERILWEPAIEIDAEYIGQIRYLNKRIEKLIDKLIKDSKTEPIIIVQSDEGPFPLQYRNDEDSFDWTKATDEQLMKKLGILNAYYFPEIDVDKILYQDITPVNSFRVILNSYFNTEMEMLPDRNYIFRDHSHLYEFFDVTGRLKHVEQSGGGIGRDSERAEFIENMDAHSYNRLGEEVGKRGNIDAAVSAFEKAYEMDPNNAEVCNNLGFVYTKKGDLERAKMYFEKALKIDPTHSKARGNLEIITNMVEQK